MMNLYPIMKFLHILAGFWFVSGVLGRGLTYSWAGWATELKTMTTLAQLSDRFERLMVVPGSGAVFLLGLLTAWQLQMPLFGFLQGYPSNWLLASIVLYFVSYGIVVSVLIPRRKQRVMVIEDALKRGEITTELTTALGDPVVNRARVVELIILILIIALMVLKPF